jgi:hypothetical protein
MFINPKVLGKSCKMVPVFLMDMMIGGKKYEWSMYFQVAVVTAGVVVFNFGAPVKAGKGGYVCVCVCVCVCVNIHV